MGTPSSGRARSGRRVRSGSVAVRENEAVHAPVGGPDGIYAGLLVVSRAGEVRLEPGDRARQGGSKPIRARSIPWLQHSRMVLPRVRLPELVVAGRRLPVKTVLVAELVHDAWNEPGSFDPEGPALTLAYADGRMENPEASNLSRGVFQRLWRTLPVAGYSRYRVSAAGIIATTDDERGSLRPMPARARRDGHLEVTLTRDGPGPQSLGKFRVDRLVAFAWCRRPSNAAASELGVLHAEGVPARCAAADLRLVTAAGLRRRQMRPLLPKGVLWRRPRTRDDWVNRHVMIATDGRIWQDAYLVRPATARPADPLEVREGRWLPTGWTRSGFVEVCIRRPDGGDYRRAVHMLVGEARDGPFANARSGGFVHRDGVREHNAEANIERRLAQPRRRS